MTNQTPVFPPPLPKRLPKSARSPSIHDGLAISAFIMAWLFPPIGFILGCVSLADAHRHDRNESGLAVAAIAFSIILTLAGVIVAVISLRSSGAPPCDTSNPAWPNC